MVMNPSSNLALTWGFGEAGILVDTGTLVVNGGRKVPISGFFIPSAVVRAVIGVVTPIFIETGIAMVAPWPLIH